MLKFLVPFVLGFLSVAIIRNITNFLCWRQGNTFSLDRPFEFYWPFVRVTWDNRRFGDGLWVFDMVIAGILSLIASNTIGALVAIAFISGSIIARWIPYLSNVSLGLIDRYNIDTKEFGGKPAAKSAAQVMSQLSAEQLNQKPTVSVAAPTGKRKQKGGWRNTC